MSASQSFKNTFLCCKCPPEADDQDEVEDPIVVPRDGSSPPISTKIGKLPDEAAYRTAASRPDRRYKTYGNKIMNGWYKAGWSSSEQSIKSYADAMIGYGKTPGGKASEGFTMVTDPSDDGKKKGTLRYICENSNDKATWVRFSDSMNIKLEEPLSIPSNITIDGRGARIEITGAMLTIENAKNIILSRLIIKESKTTGRSGKSLGYGLYLSRASKVVMDHLHLENCKGIIKDSTMDEPKDRYFGYHGDGKLIDLHSYCTDITISNCVFTEQYFNVLLGADDSQDNRNMRVTLAYCYFGLDNVHQRMPRCREGHFHVVNNIYDGFHFYCIGGSDNPRVCSENNIFRPYSETKPKFVTKWQGVWDDKIANVSDTGSIFRDGCSFESRGTGKPPEITYDRSFVVSTEQLVKALKHAGCGKPLNKP